MAIRIKSPTELPDIVFNCRLLKSEDESKDKDGYLFISKSPIMIMFFYKISDKTNKNS